MIKKPNVILITIDALRADRLGFMGYKKNISPNLDALAKESVIFTQAFSVGPSTPYSFPAILTSTYPLDYQGPQKIDRPRVLISEVLKEAGYITAAIHSNPYLSDFFGYNRGWDYFEDITSPIGKLEIIKTKRIKKFFKELFKNISFSVFPQFFVFAKYLKYRLQEDKFRLKIKASYLNQIAKDFIETMREEAQPFFLWIHYMDIHSPFLPEETYYEKRPPSFSEAVAGIYINYLINYSHKKSLRKFLERYFDKTIELYDQGIKYFDQELGRLVEFLKEKNIYQNSIIVVTSDHGEELFEHGGIEHPGISYFSRKLYNELLHVPLLIKTTPSRPRKIADKASLIDLASTLCNLIGVKKPTLFKGKDLFSFSFSPIFHQIAPHITSESMISGKIIDKLNEYKIAYQTNEWKYILDNSTGFEELYNLFNDPQEKNNLSQTQKDVLVKMRKKVEGFLKENPPLALINK